MTDSFELHRFVDAQAGVASLPWSDPRSQSPQLIVSPQVIDPLSNSTSSSDTNGLSPNLAYFARRLSSSDKGGV
jgi:hypothetical protein